MSVVEDELYSERFLVRRPLLRAIDHHGSVPPVLLVDEVDRADDEFEAFLLEILSDYAVTVPELGELRAEVPPVVILTSNRTRDVHDALKRRCLYHWIDHPDFERELAIVRLKAPEVSELARARRSRRRSRCCAASSCTSRPAWPRRSTGPARSPGWVQAHLDERAVLATLGTILKYREDQERVRAHGVAEIVRDRGGAAVPDPTQQLGGGSDRRSPSRRTLRGGGLDGRAGRRRVMFARALAAVGIDGSGRRLLGRARDARAPSRGRRGLRTLLRHPVRLRRAPRAWLRTDVVAEEVVVAYDLPGGEPSSDEAEPVDPDVPVLQVRYSPAEVLRHRDFATYSPAEHVEARRLMADLRFVGGLRRSRRLASVAPRRGGDRSCAARCASRCGPAVSRSGVRSPEPSERPRRLVFLCDVSGSMEPYARALVRFLHTVVIARGRVEAFALGTRLTRITRELSSRDPDAALAAAARRVVDWSGGTRLGEGLRAFNDEWGIRGMARGATVVVISDGWERGDADAARASRWRACTASPHKIVWVNPLKATPGYAPLAAGMAAALPFVDEFVEGHSLASLEELAAVLA